LPLGLTLQANSFNRLPTRLAGLTLRSGERTRRLAVLVGRAPWSFAWSRRRPPPRRSKPGPASPPRGSSSCREANDLLLCKSELLVEIEIVAGDDYAVACHAWLEVAVPDATLVYRLIHSMASTSKTGSVRALNRNTRRGY
jgi:hypothetical protein